MSGFCRTSLSIAVLGALSLSVAHAQGAPACTASWSSTAIYHGGDNASKNGNNFHANWWTQGDDPATHSGGSGSGQPWTSQGGCGGGGPPDDPPVDPPNDPPGTGTGSVLFSPYKDVTINLNWNTNAMQSAASGTMLPVTGSGGLLATKLPNLGAITLAFATGECGSENWGGISGPGFASANIPALAAQGVHYVISTGGQAGAFTCASAGGMANFIARYATSKLAGIDFDIEGGQTQAQISALIASAVANQGAYPNLRFSFTLATLAASDGSHGGLNSVGDMVVRAVKASALQNYTINLMVMDYGGPSAGVCVVAGGVCDMGQSAIQAAVNLQSTYGIASSKIELTPMIGLNDVSSETFRISDVDTVSNYVNANGLAGVHYWSLDRDTPCAGGASSWASPICNSTAGTTPLQYTRRFLQDLGF
ncbi:MAG: carbohydrate-binding protein [Dokdonella sp.]|uniref:carbohydrate-binding protein n=1 Tax=Dokdonella sp. TaxID=2291710 RepID=UPI003265BAC7